jgi:hypothetical protein
MNRPLRVGYDRRRFRSTDINDDASYIVALIENRRRRALELDCIHIAGVLSSPSLYYI